MTRTRRTVIRRMLVALAVIALIIAVTLWLKARARRAAEEREVRYQATLRSYSRMFTPGMTRKEVEARLRTGRIEFLHSCCMGRWHNAYDTLIAIGKEDAPWYCSADMVYIGLEFSAEGPHEFPEAQETDVLKDVRLYHRLEGCL